MMPHYFFVSDLMTIMTYCMKLMTMMTNISGAAKSIGKMQEIGGRKICRRDCEGRRGRLRAGPGKAAPGREGMINGRSDSDGS